MLTCCTPAASKDPAELAAAPPRWMLKGLPIRTSTPVTWVFLASLFDSFEADIQHLGRDISQELREAEDPENRSRCNDVHLREVPVDSEDSDIQGYVQALFCSVVAWAEDSVLQLNLVQRVGRPGGPKNKPPDILAWVHNFQTKEDLMKKVRGLTTCPCLQAPYQDLPRHPAAHHPAP
ncbi:hypothetical protein NDU88_006380 [Pleurodeles waltl]|uniref:Uncharacterized protein n=1 Tax=Pleurodeles waltl TaxID=8319 RepID=A0AAV7PKS5_PLEWA|nr:hypothetical protein NDU88_006380 [Pleurodeles waltl]